MTCSHSQLILIITLYPTTQHGTHIRLTIIYLLIRLRRRENFLTDTYNPINSGKGCMILNNLFWKTVKIHFYDFFHLIFTIFCRLQEEGQLQQSFKRRESYQRAMSVEASKYQGTHIVHKKEIQHGDFLNKFPSYKDISIFT